MRVPLPSRVLPIALPLLVLLPRAAGSVTILVPQDEPTVYAGVAAAASGDTVLVSCGTYLEHDIPLTPGVVLRGQTSGPGCVVIDGQRLGRVLFGLNLPVGTRVEDITFRNGYNKVGQDFGRRISPGPGDPVEALAPSERDYGGGGGAYLILSSVTFRGCVFESNEARVHAGAVRCEGGAPVFEDCEFRSNLAGNQGGAVYVGPGTRPTFTDCEMTSNTADYGGGIYAARPDAVTCTGCRFEGNRARVGAGGFHSSFCDPVLSGCAFVLNTAARGGALAVFGGTAVISGTSIVGNDAPLAAAIRLNTAALQLSESVVAYNTGGNVVECTSATVQLTCCDVWGNETGDYAGCLAGQDGTAGNFSADPLFCAWEYGEVTLLQGSPCLPGNNSCGVQIGAYAAPGCVPSTTLFVDTSPAGLTVDLDGATFTAPTTATWPQGTPHTVSTASPQLPVPDERYTFYAWSDSGGITHAITAPDSADTLVATFTAEYLLTVTATPGGTVTPGLGAAFHAYADVESLSAIPDSGYLFQGWNGTGPGSYTGPDSNIAVAMYGPITQDAVFNKPGYHTVTMVAGPGGTVDPPAGDYAYAESTAVVITAVADSAFRFTDWVGTGTGSYTGTANPAQIDVLSRIIQTANFEPIPVYTLTMAADPGGIVTPPTGNYLEGTMVAITAVADSDFVFSGWTGTGTGSYTGPDNPATVTVDGPLSQTAHFAPRPRYTLTMAADSGGTVTPATGDYLEGTVVTVTATPDFGFSFAGWTGTGAGSYTGANNPATVTVNEPLTQTAHFAPLPRYTLTMNADPGGTVTPMTGEYLVGTAVTITATADSGFAFTGWTGVGSGSYTGANNPATVTVNEPLTQTAHFVPLLPLTMVADPGGTVTPPSGVYPQGTVVAIEADPDPGWIFTDWTGVGSGSFTGTTNPASVTMDAAITQTAHFVQPDSFPLTMAVSPPGTGTVTPGSGTFANGDSVVISAAPATNYKFLGWLGVGQGSYLGIKQTVTIVMQDVITETAYFQELPKFTLTMIAGAGGTVTPMTAQYYTGTQVVITAVPDSGNGFVRWSGSGFGSYSGSSPSVTITLTADVTETAIFEYDVPVTIVTTPPGLRIGADGTDFVSPQTFLWRNTSFHNVDVDSLVPGLPGERDRFGGWADGVTTVARTIDVPDTGITFGASYAPERFLDFVDPPEGTGTPGDSWHPLGATVQIQAIANPGHVFNSWTGQGNGSYSGPDNPASVTMNEPLVQTSAYDSYGYEFSISASSTDPFVNTRTPTGGASSLYLWMTCTDVGIAAFEADVSSTLPYSAFNPAPGVLNAGGSTNLFLAFTGCPGAGGPYLVGTFVVTDTGGELCLVPSAASGRLGAVSCVMPTFLVDPVRLTGFSSSGLPPCFVPGTPCLLPAPNGIASAQATPPAVAAPPPSSDALLGVYPNPFLGRTTVRFSAAGTGPARLAVYDVTGRLVRVVLDRTMGPGDHRAAWDGRNGSGSSVPAGVYFVRLQVGRLDESRKIVLLDGGR